MLGTRRTAHHTAVGFGRDLSPSVRVDLRVRAQGGELLAGGILPEVAEHKALLGKLAIGMPATRFVRQGAMLKSSLICSAVCLATLSISAGAKAQALRDWTECVNEGDAFSLDVIISGCSNLIQSGKEGPAEAGRSLQKPRHRVFEKARIRPSDCRLLTRRLNSTRRMPRLTTSAATSTTSRVNTTERWPITIRRWGRRQLQAPINPALARLAGRFCCGSVRRSRGARVSSRSCHLTSSTSPVRLAPIVPHYGLAHCDADWLRTMFGAIKVKSLLMANVIQPPLKRMLPNSVNSPGIGPTEARCISSPRFAIGAG